MTTTTRQGPALTITGTCEGCCYLGRSIVARSCHSPLLGEPCLLPRAEDATIPAWCPLLPAARLALARGIVAEAEGTTVAALAADECPGKGRCHGAMKWCETCGPVAGTCDDTACDQHNAAHGAGESEEQKR